MRLHILLFIAMLMSTLGISAAPDTITIDNNKLLYHLAISKKQDKAGLIIYLHGGVSQFKGHNTSLSIPLNEMFEGNTYFLQSMLDAGYDVITPIAYNQYNWLEEKGATYILQLLKKHQSNYKQIILSGFSDGATGAYRIFYAHAKLFTGVWMFNGFPQLDNHYKKTDHYKGIGKHVLYYSTASDKNIAYEFLLLEYRRQSILNQHTYFYLRDGNHSFKAYTKNDFEAGLKIFSLKHEQAATDGQMNIYAPIDGFVLEKKLLEVYPFRSKIGKRYSVMEHDINRTDYSYKELSKKLSNHSIYIQPTTISKESLKTKDILSFNVTIDDKKEEWTFTNWLNRKPFK